MMIHNTDFLFVGGVFPKEDEKNILKKSKRGLQMAANNFQWSLIHGFDYNLSNPVTILNTMFIGSYPANYKDIIIHSKHFSHASGAKDYNLGFLNLAILKHFVRPFGGKRILRKWLNANKEINKKIAFIYSLSPRSVQIAKELKRINPKIHICVSVNDLPENIMLGYRGNSKIVKIWKDLSKIRISAGLKYIDSYMIVTEQIITSLNIEDKPYVIVEALTEIEQKRTLPKSTNSDNIKRVVYTGGLIEKYGVLNLVNAFTQIKSEDYNLIICGDGDCKGKIIELSKTDKRINYLGVMSKKEVSKIQESATVLINPRQNKGDYTKYSFPIKTIEYLLSGKPVIAYKLDGIPNEYNDHLIYVNDDSIESLKDKIIEVCSMPNEQLIEIGEKNKRFVVEQKNNILQTKRILSMMLNNSNFNKIGE